MKNKLKYLIIMLLFISISGCKEKNNDKSLTFGKLLEFKESCTNYDSNENCTNLIAIIKAEIKNSYSNKATVDQNYYNISAYIKNNDVSKYTEIEYWAIDNNQEKIISFSLTKEIIEKIKNNEIADNQLGNYANNLYIKSNLK